MPARIILPYWSHNIDTTIVGCYYPYVRDTPWQGNVCVAHPGTFHN